MSAAPLDYRALLVRYIDHVGQCEGTVFLSSTYRGIGGVPFTDEEWAELERLAELTADKAPPAPPAAPEKPAGAFHSARPDNCTMALREAGKPAPKSGCDVCGNGGMMGCPYDRRAEA
jgi:hypothetical protein